MCVSKVSPCGSFEHFTEMHFLILPMTYICPAGMKPGFPVTLTSLSQMNKNTFNMLLYTVQSILG